MPAIDLPCPARPDVATLDALLHMVRELAPAASAVGLLALLYDGQVVVRGRGQWRVWAAAPAPTGWTLCWEPVQGRTRSTVLVANQRDALGLIGAWLASELQRRRVKIAVVLPTMSDVMPRAPGCRCHLEEGDSPCPVHGQEE